MEASKTRYQSTAELMDEALLLLLGEKELEYITVKEICERAGVHRSTFYLHYETLDDLLSESVEFLLGRFRESYGGARVVVAPQIAEAPLGELYLVTDEYLLPCLGFIRDNARLFGAAVANSQALRLERVYSSLRDSLLSPILDRFRVPEEDRGYMMSFYRAGLMAVVEEWLRGGCADPPERVARIMRQVVDGVARGEGAAGGWA